jgi:hypothetical protein
MHDDAEYLPVAVRAWPVQPGRPGAGAAGSPADLPRTLLVTGAETTADSAEALTFGSARLVRVRNGSVRPERPGDRVLFHADDLEVTDPGGLKALRAYGAAHGTVVISKGGFAEHWVWEHCVRRVQKGRYVYGTATLTGYNLPFVLSRLAYDAWEGRAGRENQYGYRPEGHPGWFGFRLFENYVCPDDCDRGHRHIRSAAPNRFRPHCYVKSLNAKAALFKWGRYPDNPSRGMNGQHPDRFLDVRQLLYALTDHSVALVKACEMLGVPVPESGPAGRRGVITPDAITQSLRSADAIAEVAARALGDFGTHPVTLTPAYAASPATLAKAYLKTMGITPVLSRPGSEDDPVLLGNAMSAFYGGRSECKIRKTPVPVELLDYVSMYPTVNVLMGTWDLITANRIEPADATDWLRGFLDDTGVDQVLNPAVWPSFCGIAQVVPDGDVLPVRAAFSGHEGDWNTAVSVLHSPVPLWYPIADVVAAALLSGKTPKVVRAVRFVPGGGKLRSLRPVVLAGAVPVDPRRDDFFRVCVEQRQAHKRVHGERVAGCPGCNAGGFLKLLANSGSYGIYAQFIRDDSVAVSRQEMAGASDRPWSSPVAAVESPQEFTYAPVASAITGAARLMLAILEKLVTAEGGSWLLCDTDSMAVVADEDGSVVPTSDGRTGIQALSYGEVDKIRAKINGLNPYEHVPHLLKAETPPGTWGYGISAKRYALYSYSDGRPVVPELMDGERHYSEHGLGLFAPPDDAADPWIRRVWQHIIDEAHGLSSDSLPWAEVPAVFKTAVSAPYILRAFGRVNEGKPYAAQVKPFSFLASIGDDELRLTGSDGGRRRLLAPWEETPGDWLTAEWTDMHAPGDGPLSVAVDGRDGTVKVRPVSGRRSVVAEFTGHAEDKANGPDGRKCGSETTGVLSRRVVRVLELRHVGKETNRLDDAQAGLLSSGEVKTDYGVSGLGLAQNALADMSLRAISRKTAEYAAMIEGKLADAETAAKHEFRFRADRTRTLEAEIAINRENVTRVCGEPVKLDLETIGRWKNGGALRFPAQATLLVTVAARFVAAELGIVPETIVPGWRLLGSGGTDPRVVLAKWNESREGR